MAPRPSDRRDADHCSLGDGLMGKQHRLDLSRINVLPSGDDQVLDAIFDVQVAVPVDASNVIRAQPPTGSYHLDSCLRESPIPRAHLRTPDRNLADRAGLDVDVCFEVKDSNLYAGDRTSRRPQSVTLAAVKVVGR